MARLVNATQCVCAELIDNYLYVQAKVGFAFVICRYDSVSNAWETLPHFQGSRASVGCSLCSVDEHLYAFSDSDAPQRYSLAQNDWQSGSELPFLKTKDSQESLVFVKAVSMKSKIYVLHGYYRQISNGHSRAFEARPAVVHCFDPQKNEWREKASTLHPHFESSLIVDNNRLYVAGGRVSVSRENRGLRASGNPAPVEVYNEFSDYWSIVDQKHIPSNHLGAVEILGGKVYFLLNKFPFDSGIRIPPKEVYKISLRGWEHLSTIGSAAVLCYLSVKKDMLTEKLQAAAKSQVTRELEQN